MRQSETVRIQKYFYNQTIHSVRDVNRLQSTLRYRDADIVDCIELAVAIAVRDTVKRVSSDVRHLLNLGKVN